MGSESQNGEIEAEGGTNTGVSGGLRFAPIYREHAGIFEAESYAPTLEEQEREGSPRVVDDLTEEQLAAIANDPKFDWIAKGLDRAFRKRFGEMDAKESAADNAVETPGEVASGVVEAVDGVDKK